MSRTRIPDRWPWMGPRPPWSRRSYEWFDNQSPDEALAILVARGHDAEVARSDFARALATGNSIGRSNYLISVWHDMWHAAGHVDLVTWTEGAA